MPDVKEKVNTVFETLTRGGPAPKSVLASGWEMQLPSGETVPRSRLDEAAQPLVDLGQEAVPELLNWAAHENLAVRYVAVYALQRITGLQPFVSHFDREDKEGDRTKAIDEWRRWYQQRTKR